MEKKRYLKRQKVVKDLNDRVWRDVASYLDLERAILFWDMLNPISDSEKLYFTFFFLYIQRSLFIVAQVLKKENSTKP